MFRISESLGEGLEGESLSWCPQIVVSRARALTRVISITTDIERVAAISITTAIAAAQPAEATAIVGSIVATRGVGVVLGR